MTLFVICVAVVIAIVAGVAFFVLRPLLKGNRRTR